MPSSVESLLVLLLGAAACGTAVGGRKGWSLFGGSQQGGASAGTTGAVADSIATSELASTAATDPVEQVIDDFEDFDLDHVKEQCSKITECYCIKGTSCGWCESTKEAMLGTSGGPMGADKCRNWIPWAVDCPVLYCHADETSEVWWWFSCGWLPALCLLAWITTLIRSRSAQGQYDASHQEFAALDNVVFASGQATLVSNLGDIRNEEVRGAKTAERIAWDFFGTKRSLEVFRKGMNCPASERLPTKVSRPWELSLSDLSSPAGQNFEKSRVGPHRFSVTLSVALQWRSALGATVVSALGLMLLSSLWIMFMRNAARTMHEPQFAWLALVFDEIGAVVVPLQTAVSMLLSFYALNRISWFWSILMQGHALQGRAHDIAMIGGAIKENTDEDWMARYTLFRHLMLTFFFSYQQFTPSMRFAGFGPLLNCGLMNQEEADILEHSHRGPGTVCESWLSHWIQKHLDLEPRQQAFHALREFRGAIAVAQALVDQRAPVSFESLLFCTVYALVAILPFSPSSLNYDNRQAVMEGAHIATVLGVGIICSFYLSLIHLLRHLQAPFDTIGAPNDALNPLALMNSTERKLWDYLTLPPAPPSKVPAGAFGMEKK